MTQTVLDLEDDPTIVLRMFCGAPPEAEPRARATAFQSKDGKMRARVYKPDNGKAASWRQELHLALRPHVPSVPWDGPLGLILEFRFARPKSHLRANGGLKPSVGHIKGTKPDLDNLQKLVMDVMTRARLWNDDGQVGCLYSRKTYVNGGEKPGVEVILWRIPASEK